MTLFSPKDVILSFNELDIATIFRQKSIASINKFAQVQIFTKQRPRNHILCFSFSLPTLFLH